MHHPVTTRRRIVAVAAVLLAISSTGLSAAAADAPATGEVAQAPAPVPSADGADVTRDGATRAAGPVITLHPRDVTVDPGQDAILTAAATGDPTPSVQWEWLEWFEDTNPSTGELEWRERWVAIPVNTSNLSGQNTPTLTLANRQSSSGPYRALFTNSQGQVGSAEARVVVNRAPSVLAHPASTTVLVGEAASFTVRGSGLPEPAVQWQTSEDGTIWTDVPGTTSATYAIPAVSADQDGWRYRAVLTNHLGSVTTDPATLTVRTTSPVITTQPQDVTVTENHPATFTAAADGSPTPSVQWQTSPDGAEWTDVAGATSTTYTVDAPTADQDGTRVRAVFANVYGTVESDAATLAVQRTAAITQPPEPTTVFEGQTATFRMRYQAGDTGALLQWQRSDDGGSAWTTLNIAACEPDGDCPTAFTVGPVDLTWDGLLYRMVVSDSHVQVESDPVRLTVLPAAPVIDVHPEDVRVTAPRPATFTAAATGRDLAVQWQSSPDGLDWSDLPGETGTTLTVAAVTAEHDGTSYRAVFSNDVGVAETEPAVLRVDLVPAVTVTVTPVVVRVDQLPGRS